MKKSSIKILYRLFAFLSDRTNGFAPFVKYKLTLGVILIGLGACSNQNKKNVEPNDISPITSTSGSNIVEKSDSVDIEKQLKKDTLPVKKYVPPIIEATCYDIVETPDDNKITSGQKSKSDDLGIEKIDSDTVLVSCYLVINIEDVEAANKDIVLKYSNDSTIYTIVDRQPEFPGGDHARIDFIQKTLRYPENESNIQGRVIVNFIVEKDGTINDIQVVRSIAPELDKEAVRIIQLMPKWIPGNHKGEIVRVRFTLPINFKK